MRRFWRAIILLAALLAAGRWSASAVGAEPAVAPTASTAAPLLFRRIFAPADRVQDWPRGTVRYVPVDREEFERLVKSAQEMPGLEGKLAAAIVRATYAVEFDGHECLIGRAKCDVQHTGRSPTIMALDPWGLALRKAWWHPADQPDARLPAELGTDSAGRAALAVAHSGELEFEFSLRGRRDGDGRLTFPLELPGCAASVMILEVPQRTVVDIIGGLVLADTDAELGTEHGIAKSSTSTTPKKSDAVTMKTYRILLSGASPSALRLSLHSDSAPSVAPALLREAVTYDVSPRGVDVTAVWKLDVVSGPLRQLQVALDPGLRLVTARLGEAEMSFSQVADAQSGETTAVLTLPEALSGTDRSLRLAAIGPLPPQESWRLPRMRTQSAVWQEGTYTVLVREPLSVAALTPQRARQTRYSLLPAPREGEAFDVQLYSPEATVELALVRQAPLTEMSLGTQIDVGDAEVKAQTVAVLPLGGDRPLVLAAAVRPGWTIDSVETEPREALAGWRFATVAEAPTLSIEWARPLAAETAVRLAIRGHRETAANDGAALTAGDLAMLRFRDAEVKDQLLTIRPPAGREARLTEVSRLERLETSRLEPEQLALLPEAPRHPVYRWQGSECRFTVQIEAPRPRYLGEIRAEAIADATAVEETYAIACVPEGDRVARVLVQLSQARDEPLRWSLLGEGHGSLAARRLSAQEQTARRIVPTPEAWELSLSNPRTARFEIAATRTTPMTNQLPLALVSLPEAIRQRAQLTIKAAADVPISIRNDGVRSVDAIASNAALAPGSAPRGTDPATSSDADGMVRAVYEYDLPDASMGVALAREAQTLPQPSAVVWQQRIQTRCDASGQALHRLTYRIQNAGRSQVTLTEFQHSLPSKAQGLKFARVWVDGKPQSVGTPPTITVPIEPDRRFVTIEVECLSSFAAPGLTGSLAAPRVDIDVPVLETQWVLWLPAGYELLSSTGGSAEPAPRELSWSQRLFGPLGRPTTTPTLELLSTSDWAALLPARLTNQRERSYQLLDRIRVQVTELAKNDSALTWGQVLAADAAANGAGETLFVDAVAWDDADVGQQSPVPITGRGASNNSRTLLEESGLTLLVTPSTALLTSRLSASLHRSQLDWIEPGVIAAVSPGPLAEAIDAAAEGSTTAAEAYLPAARWVRDAANPWQGATRPQPAMANSAVARPLIIRAEPQAQLSARLVRESSSAVAGWATCVCVLAICTVWFGNRGPRLLVALFLAAALALVVPTIIAPIATGCAWGILLALLWHTVPRTFVSPLRRSAALASSSSYRVTGLSEHLVPMILIAAWLVGFDPLVAAQAPKKGNDRQAEVHRVFVPVDENEQPTEDKYQVPESLYDELRRRAGDTSGNGEQWLLTSARYQVAVHREPANEAITAGDVQAHYQIQVLRADSVIRLPLVGVRPGPTAKLDDQTIQLAWEADEDGIACHFEEPGTYELEFVLRPARGELGMNGLDLPIPRVVRSLLEVQLPNDSVGLEVSSALGAVTTSADGRKLSADLGPQDRLTLSWGRSKTLRPGAAEMDAWMWLQVQPGAVTLQAHLDVRSARSGPLRELQLTIDPRLRPLPPADKSGLVKSVQVLPEDARTVRIELTRPISDPATVPVSFLLTGTTGVGQLQLPHFAPQGGRFADRVLAVSVDPGLEAELPTVPAAAALAVPDFLAHWGRVPEPPQSVVRLPADADWSIATRPRQAQFDAKQSLALSVDAGRAEVQFTAQLTPTAPQAGVSSYVGQHKLRIPREVQVESVSLLQDGIERLARWTRDPVGNVTAFLASPVPGNQELRLTGTIDFAAPGDLRLPCMNLESVEHRETAVLVYRQTGAHVSVYDLNGLTPKALPPTASEPAASGRVVATLAATADDFSATLRVSPNRPQIHSTQTTEIRCDNDRWEGRSDYYCRVEDGTLDAIQFRLPAEWLEPLKVSSATPIDVVKTDAPNRRLIVRPKTAIDGEFRCTIAGPVRLAPGENLALPALLPANGEVTEVRVNLPTRMGDREIQWDTAGLHSLRLDLPAQGWNLEMYRAAQGDVAVRLEPLSARAVPRRAARADIHFAWTDGARGRGLAMFDLEPSAKLHCELLLPEGTEILELRVAGMPVTAVAAENGWRIPLPGGEETVRVEAAFTGPIVNERFSSRVTVAAPWVHELNVERTRWTVYRPSESGPGAPTDDSLALDKAVPPRDVPLNTADTLSTTFGNGPADSWIFAADVPALTIRYAGLPGQGLLGRIGLALVLAGCGLAFALPRNQTRLAFIPARWPWIAGLFAGVLVWLWIAPAWAGLAIVALCVVALLWRPPAAQTAAPVAPPDSAIRNPSPSGRG